MKIKEFFRPTKGKIIIVILIFVLSLFFGFKEIPGGKLEITEGGALIFPNPGDYSYWEFNKIVFPLSDDICPFLLSPSIIIIAFGIIYLCGIIYWYLLACLIIFVYQKLKRGLKRKNN